MLQPLALLQVFFSNFNHKNHFKILGFGGEIDTAGPNFVITKGEKKEQEKEKKKTGMSKEQKEAAKSNYMSIVNKPGKLIKILTHNLCYNLINVT